MAVMVNTLNHLSHLLNQGSMTLTCLNQRYLAAKWQTTSPSTRSLPFRSEQWTKCHHLNL